MRRISRFCGSGGFLGFWPKKGPNWVFKVSLEGVVGVGYLCWQPSAKSLPSLMRP